MTHASHVSETMECAAGQEHWHPQAGSTLLPGAPAPLAYQGIRIFGVLTIVASAIFCPDARASEPAMAIAQGMGETSRSSLEDGGAAYTAPATIWLNSGFDVSGGARIGTGQSRLYQAAAQDAQTGPVGLGIQWFRHDQDLSPSPGDLPGWKKPGTTFENPSTTSVFAASLSGGGVHHLMGYAVGLRYYSRVAPVTGTQSELNAVVSAGFVVRDQLVITVTGENLIPQSGFDDAPLGIGTGLRWQAVDTFAIAFDTFTDFESVDDGAVTTPMAGMEYRVVDLVPLRVGWKHNAVTEQSFITGGIGLSNDQTGLHYGAKVALGDDGDRAHWHGLSLRATF